MTSQKIVENHYKKFNDYFKSIYSIKEENTLKSTILKPNKYLYELASFKKDDLDFNINRNYKLSFDGF